MITQTTTPLRRLLVGGVLFTTGVVAQVPPTPINPTPDAPFVWPTLQDPSSQPLRLPSDLTSDAFYRAGQLRTAGRNAEALTAVNDAIRQNPNRGEAYALRSGILGNLQHYEDGVADANLGITLSTTPRNRAIAAYNKGFNLGSLHRNQEALEAYKAALKFDPTYSMPHFGRGKLFYLLGMWKEATSELDSAIGQNPKLGAAWAYRAESQFKLGETGDGMASAEKAVELAPSDSRSFRARAIGHQLSMQYDEMLADATRALELDPARPLAHLLRGRALGFLGRYDEAVGEYAAEPDRKAVEPYLTGVHQVMYGTRIYNCGDSSTDFEIAGGPRIDTFSGCTQRIADALVEGATQTAAPTPARKSVPNLAARRKGKK